MRVGKVIKINMKEIEMKILELNELLEKIPQECKGEGNSENRRKWMLIKRTIHDLMEKI